MNCHVSKFINVFVVNKRVCHSYHFFIWQDEVHTIICVFIEKRKLTWSLFSCSISFASRHRRDSQKKRKLYLLTCMITGTFSSWEKRVTFWKNAFDSDGNDNKPCLLSTHPCKNDLIIILFVNGGSGGKVVIFSLGKQIHLTYKTSTRPKLVENFCLYKRNLKPSTIQIEKEPLIKK